MVALSRPFCTELVQPAPGVVHGHNKEVAVFKSDHYREVLLGNVILAGIGLQVCLVSPFNYERSQRSWLIPSLYKHRLKGTTKHTHLNIVVSSTCHDS